MLTQGLEAADSHGCTRHLPGVLLHMRELVHMLARSPGGQREPGSIPAEAGASQFHQPANTQRYSLTGCLKLLFKHTVSCSC